MNTIILLPNENNRLNIEMICAKEMKTFTYSYSAQAKKRIVKKASLIDGCGRQRVSPAFQVY